MKRLKDGHFTLLQNPSTYKTPIRYFLAVAIGFCVDFVIYATLVTYDISIYYANAAGFCVGLTVNVILIRKLVFPNSRFQFITDLQLSFASSGLMFVFGMGMLWVLVELVDINIYGAKLLTNGTTFFANYMLRAIFFRKK